jgi:alkylation response protein AidB-like acyl-CoA dehydrogenase
MDVSYPPEAEAFREKIQAFLAQNLPADWNGIGALDRDEASRFVDGWRRTLRANGLLAVSWPSAYGGGGLSPLEQVVLAEEFTKAGVPMQGRNDGFGITMLGNTILRWGSEEQKSHYIPRILDGDDVWCQGYSEPNAGSDLGNLGCRAVLDGDEWVINGQKIWTSGAHNADHIFVLARTDADAPKHAGITFLLVDMRQPGVEVRPIRMISGESEFNEVFFTDARCAKDAHVGQINGGWAVAMTLLGFERGAGATTQAIRFSNELARLKDLARERGANEDPAIRQRLAWVHSKVEIMRYIGLRTLTEWLGGGQPGAQSSIMKLYWSELHKQITELALDILGADALTPAGSAPTSVFGPDEPGAPNETSRWVGTFLNARAGTIYAGSSQVQKNIAGEMILGLPKEPRADAGPWKTIPGHA